MGIYLFERDVMRAVLTAHPEEIDFGREIIPRAIAERRVVSYPFADYWSDIGTIRSFFDANLALADPDPAFDLYDEARPIYTNARMLPPAKLQGATVRNSMIGEASVVIGATVEESVIGIRSFIGAGAHVRRTVMLGADYFPWHDPGRRHGTFPPPHPGIGEGAVVENTLVDKNAQIGRGCRITNEAGVDEADGDGWVIRDGIVVIRKNAVIADGTVI